MKVREERVFYYTAAIYRAQQRVIRQGTISAESELEAIERVYEMGRTVWSRTILEVNIMDPVGGELLATSHIGEKVEKNLIGSGVKAAVTPTVPEKKEGFIPWNERIPPQDPPFYATQIGSHFVPMQFFKLTGM